MRIRFLPSLFLMLAFLLGGTPLVSAQQVPKLPFNFGGAFELVDQDGQIRTDQDFHGKFMLVYFGYTYCPDICPTDLYIMSQALEQIGPAADKIQPVFITVDPARDTPDLLKEYVANFHPNLTGLSGSEVQIRSAAKAYRVHRVKVPQPDSEPDEYLVNHSSLTYLMGPDGHFISLIPHGTSTERMAEILAKYVSAKSS